MEAQLELSAPWQALARKFTALFAQDPETTVEARFTREERCIDIRVDNPAKASALSQLLPEKVDFGNVAVAINVIPANVPSAAALLRTAFAGNSALVRVSESAGPRAVTYAEFAPKVVQFWNDDLANPYGVSSILMETLGKEILAGTAANGVLITTAAN